MIEPYLDVLVTRHPILRVSVSPNSESLRHVSTYVDVHSDGTGHIGVPFLPLVFQALSCLSLLSNERNPSWTPHLRS